MTRKVFYSFHFDNDAWRAAQVRNMGVIDGSEPIKGNCWEDVKAKSEAKIEEWINDNLKDKSCLVVLIGEKTSERKWVQYEIETALNLGKAVCGVYINRLKNEYGKQSDDGENPFNKFQVGNKNLSDIVPVFKSSYLNSQDVYNDIKENLKDLVEKVIFIHNKKN